MTVGLRTQYSPHAGFSGLLVKKVKVQPDSEAIWKAKMFAKSLVGPKEEIKKLKEAAHAYTQRCAEYPDATIEIPKAIKDFDDKEIRHLSVLHQIKK